MVCKQESEVFQIQTRLCANVRRHKFAVQVAQFWTYPMIHRSVVRVSQRGVEIQYDSDFVASYCRLYTSLIYVIIHIISGKLAVCAL